MTPWQQVAIKEGRVCPECKQPVSIQAWIYMNRKFMRRQKKVDICLTCKLAHWEIPLYDCGGNVMEDNADREAYDSN